MRSSHVPGPSGGTKADDGPLLEVPLLAVVESSVARQQPADDRQGDDVGRVQDAHDQQDAADACHLVLQLRARRRRSSRRAATNVTVKSTNDVKMR